MTEAHEKMIRKMFVFLFAVFTYSFVYYELHPFVYGSANNVEEIPIINKYLGLASYPNDSYVDSTSGFTQATPYILFMTMLAKIFSQEEVYVHVFYLVHFLLLVLLFISLRKLHQKIISLSETSVIASLILMMFFLETTYIIPANKWLFYDFLDPEFATIPFLFLTVLFFIAEKRLLSILTLLVATIIHPLYAIPLMAGLILSLVYKLYKKEIELKDFLLFSVLYFFTTVLYSFILWLPSHQTIPGPILASKVIEIVRIPHVSKIPTLFTIDLKISFFYLFSLFSPLLGLLYEKNKPNKFLRNLSVLNISLIAFLFMVSFITSFIQIPILVQLTPYRIAAVIVPISWIILFSIFVDKYSKISLKQRDILFISVIFITAVSLSSFKYSKESKPNTIFINKNETAKWIKQNTNKNALFLNYTDIDVRTKALRPDYFKFLTLPLTANAQLNWYERYIVYFDVPDGIKKSNYQAIKEYAEKKHKIGVSSVIKRSNLPIKYVLISKTGKSFSEITEWLGITNDYESYDLSGLKKAYENESYEVYKPIEEELK